MTDKPNPRDSLSLRIHAGDLNYDADVPEQRTIEFSSEDPNKTVDPTETVDIEPNKSDASFDPYATDIASTPAPSSDYSGVSTVLPDPATSESSEEKSLSTSKTVAAFQVGQTVELVGSEAAGIQTDVSQRPASVDGASTPRSVLFDANISQTVNPRDLSDEDAAFWDGLSVPATGSQTSRLSPAINRSLSETKLHLRDQLVVDARSEIAGQSDYRLVRLLGKGGMGNVHVARQRSLDRFVAVKVIKPLDEDKKKQFRQKGTLEQVEQQRRLQFISEAVVTGDLDHPNIVPIHDIAVTGNNTLFYSMKRVSGTPWSKVIGEMSRDENIDILLKVCDAIGFAHTRGVVHRDVKPENIMLGEFGVVMVMDWGLALAKPEFEKLDSVHHATGLGGSPAYMAPEMATGPIDRIGPASDIYLLGATLFQIITTFAPHQASNVSECLKAVATNKIREVPKELHGELLQVAHKAMATRPEDRYHDVRSFQDAIRDYRAHSESIRLSSDAHDDLERAVRTSAYDDYSRSLFGFEEAVKLWPGNTKAVEGLKSAILEYAQAAYQKGDFDLGLSLLDDSDATHQQPIEQLKHAKKERVARVVRLSLLRKVAAAMLAFIIVGGATAMYAIHQRSVEATVARQQTELSLIEVMEQKKIALMEKAEADQAKDQARVAEEIAVLERDKARNAEEQQRLLTIEAIELKNAESTAKVDALAKRQEAEAARKIAEVRKQEAEDATRLAVQARQAAEYEKYVSNIGLAKATIDKNEFTQAQRILNDLRTTNSDHARTWEWRWLWRQTTQDLSSIATQSPARSIDLSGPAGTVATVMDNGAVQFSKMDGNGILASIHDSYPLGTGDAAAITFAPDHESIAVGTYSGDIEIWDRKLAEKKATWTAHKNTINRLRFIDDNILVSASDDNSIRVWDVGEKKELAACWNLGPIKDFAIAPSGFAPSAPAWTMVAAVAESTSGRATTWRIDRRQSEWKSKLIGEFLEHNRPVLCVAVSPNGETALSGDIDGNVFVWNIADARAIDYKNELQNAIEKASGDGNETKSAKLDRSEKTKFHRLIEPDLMLLGDASELAHSDRVRVVRFSSDGKWILSGGDDYVIRLWDAATWKRTKKLRGHGGWILDANFVGQSSELVVSSSADATIRTWQPKTYVNAAVPKGHTTGEAEPFHKEEILSARLNATGDAVVTASRDRTAKVSKINPVDLTTEQIAVFHDDEDTVALQEGTQFIAQSMAIDLEHSLLYIASADAIVRVWDLSRGTELFQLNETGLNTSLALSRDGRYLLTRSSSKDARSLLWRIDPVRKIFMGLPIKLDGHAKELAVTALAISADGSTLFTGDNAGIGMVWDGRTGKQIGAKLEALRGYRINAAEFSTNGKDLFIAADDQQLTRIDLNTRAVVSRLNHQGFVTSLSLSPDNGYAVTISEHATADESRLTATLWNLTTGTSQIVDRATQHTKTENRPNSKQERIITAQFGPDGRSFAIGKQTDIDRSGRIIIWSLGNATQATPIHAFKLPSALGTPQVCVPLPNDRMLSLHGDAAFQWELRAGVSRDQNTKTASHVLSYRANAAVHHANFSSDGKFVITGSQSVKIWDLEKQNRSVAKIETPHDGLLTSVAFSPKVGSFQFATSGSDGCVKLFDFVPKTLATNALQTWFNEQTEKLPPIRRVCFSNDGSMLLAVGDGGIIRLIDLNDKQKVAVYDAPDAGNLIAAAFSSDGKQFIVGGDDSKARLWQVAETGVVNTAPPIIFEGHADRIEDIKVLSTDAGPLRVLTASRDKSARVWDPRVGAGNKTGREILSLRQHTQGVTAVDATDNGNLVITAGRDTDLVLWPASPQDAK